MSGCFSQKMHIFVSIRVFVFTKKIFENFKLDLKFHNIEFERVVL